MATELHVCIDFGSDAVKIAYACQNGKKLRYGKLLSPSMYYCAVPTVAFYDTETKEWKFGEDINSSQSRPLTTVVKISTLLSMLLTTNNVHYYMNENHFPKFSFPERHLREKEFKDLISKYRTFTVSRCTPQQLCRMFFQHLKQHIDAGIQELSKETKLQFKPLTKISLITPRNETQMIINELCDLIQYTFKVRPYKELSSTQALGLLAYHKKLITTDDRSLIFDIGNRITSVSKIWLNTNNDSKTGVLVDGRDAHLPPVQIGGVDMDEALVEMIENNISERETIGYPSSGSEGHIHETGLITSQYQMTRDIKHCKEAMNYYNTIFKTGVPLTIHREIMIQRKITLNAFRDCLGIGSSGKGDTCVEQLLEYIQSELALPVNKDVTHVLLAGGAIQTEGLFNYVQSEIHKLYPNIVVQMFSETTNNDSAVEIQFNEAAVYSVALGGAIVSLKDYSVDNVLSYSYGTWVYPEGSDSKCLKLFAEKGSVLNEEGVTEFGIATQMDLPTDKESLKISDEELFATIATTAEIQGYKYAHCVEYYANYVKVGDEGSEPRILAEKELNLKTICGGQGSEVQFFYKGTRVALKGIRMGERLFALRQGFRVTPDGKGTPFYENEIKANRGINVFIRPLDDKKDLPRMVHLNEIELKIVTTTGTNIEVATQKQNNKYEVNKSWKKKQ